MIGRVVVGFAMLVAGCAVQAQTMKPGLWEMSSKMQSSGGEMEKAMAEANKHMAALPPDQRKMMQDMMAKQGVSMGAGAGGAVAIKVCLTKELIEKNAVAAQPGDCKQTVSPRVGNSMKFSYVCAKPPSNGEGQVTFNSAESYTVRVATNTQVQGRLQSVNMDSSGKWLGANCGDIKPLAMPKK